MLITVFPWFAGANNVRIEGDVRVIPEDVNMTTGVATVRFTVKWDNSWKDAFNFDGVYLFFKFKVDGDNENWHHAYLMNEGHSISSTDGIKYEMWMSNSSGAADRCEGLFIYRADKSYGSSEVDLELKWQIESNSARKLKYDDFVTGSVFLSAMGIEMVYLPRGAFRAGDTQSAMTFKNNDVSIPADEDILTDKKYVYTSSCQVDDKTKGANPPEFAVNRVNDPGTTQTNAWVGCLKDDPTATDWWEVNFGDESKTIYNIAIESVPGGKPTRWRLEGTTGSSGTWTNLYEGTGDDWMTGSPLTYPCTHAIQVTNTGTGYKRVRINILETEQPVVIKNVAMTTENIFDYVDNSVLISGPQTDMNNRIGLYADDGDDKWYGKTPLAYPNGYPAFWAMKYEISQEQYVAFLNKLTIDQQKARTIQSAMENLKEGDYVFNPSADKTRPVSRNGIVLASKGQNGEPCVFANNLNWNDDYAQDGDGQTLACNFLNAGDMMAYADWCGLRPLSELEFEKMGRRPFPEAAIWNEYAWNANTGYSPSTTIPDVNAGSKQEKPDGNVNAERKLKGPVRCGAYAANLGGQTAAGASFWGVMELSGNLAEIYYNANIEGRRFCANKDVHHGNGTLDAIGNSDMSNTYWPISEKAFGVRGGSYRSDKAQLAISDRSKHWGVFNTSSEVFNQKDSTMTFRLGHTAPVLTVIGEVALQNGVTSAEANPIDTVCSGEDYVIEGTIPADVKGAYRIAWFQSEGQDTLWHQIPGQEEPTLKVSNLRNVNEETYFFKEYRFQRRIYSNSVDVVQSRPVKVMVVNHDVQISRLRDTVDIYDHSAGIQVTASQPSEFKWWWVLPSGNRELKVEYELEENISYINYMKYSDFVGVALLEDEEVKVMVEANVMSTCFHRDTIRVVVVKKPERQYNLVDNLTNMNPDFKCGDILIDNEPIGNNLEYKTVKVGNRCWFAENLRRWTAGAKCYNTDVLENASVAIDNENCKKYGLLYNWNTAVIVTTAGAQGICPKGWHVPTDAEWAQLANDVNNEKFKLKSSLNNWAGQKGYDASSVGSNESRFSALAGGAYSTNYNLSYMSGFNGFGKLGEAAFWWSSTSVWARIGTTTHSSSWTYNCWGDYSGICLDGTQPHYATLTQSLGWESGTGNQSWMYSGVSHGAGYSLNNDATLLLSGQYMSVRCIKDGTVE